MMRRIREGVIYKGLAMSNPVIVGLAVLVIFAIIIGVIAVARQNNIKKLRVKLPGGVGVSAEAFDRPKGAATIEDVRAGNISAINKTGGDATVKRAEAKGTISADVSSNEHPN
jgi:hypothetical protein